METAAERCPGIPPASLPVHNTLQRDRGRDTGHCLRSSEPGAALLEGAAVDAFQRMGTPRLRRSHPEPNAEIGKLLGAHEVAPAAAAITDDPCVPDRSVAQALLVPAPTRARHQWPLFQSGAPTWGLRWTRQSIEQLCLNDTFSAPDSNHRGYRETMPKI